MNPVLREALAGTASLLEDFAAKAKEPPGHGYRERTIEVSVWDQCDAGGESVDAFDFDDGEAEAIAAMIRAALAERLSRRERQTRVVEFVRAAFGDRNMDRKERAARLLEEALEIAQAEGMTVAEVSKLGNHVYAKPIGIAEQEAGGVSIALLAYCASIEVSADDVETAELERLLTKPLDYFRARHQAKAAAGVAMPSGDGATK